MMRYLTGYRLKLPQQSPAIEELSAEFLKMPIRELELSIRASNCLEKIGITDDSTISQLTNKTEEELLDIQHFGKTTLREIKRKLRVGGLYLR